MSGVGRLLVVGDPVAHSLSPVLQTAMLDELGLPYRYDYQTVPAGELGSFLTWARAECAGFNATMPLKELLLPRLDRLSDEAAAIGAVNTVCIRNGLLYGHNTDGRGFVRGLAEAGFAPKGRRAVLFGAGGAARAVAHALVTAGVAALTICNRTVLRAEAICAANPLVMTPSAEFACDGADLLVNCTSLGMSSGGGQFAAFEFLDALPPHALVSDLIYRPDETELLRQAARRGLAVQNGLSMLMHQAVLALELFCETEIDPRRVLPVVRAALAEVL